MEPTTPTRLSKSSRSPHLPAQPRKLAGIARTEGEPVATETDLWPPSKKRIEAACNGDRAELGRILSTGFPKLVAFYRGLGLRSADAEDLAAEACEGMVRSLRKLREPDAFEGWFWTVARNRFRSLLRKKGRVERELEYGPVDDPQDMAVISHEHDLIREALAELSTRDRQILWLREVEGLSHQEIAGRFGLAAGAIRVAALRARRRLEEIYEQLDQE